MIENSAPISALEKAEELIRLINHAPQGLTIFDLLAVTNQSKSAIHRTLLALNECGWIESRKLNGRSLIWMLSTDFVRMAFQWKRSILAGNTNIGDFKLFTSKKPNNSDPAAKAVRLFHLVVAGGLQGMTFNELWHAAGYSRSTTYRLLSSWEQLGWLSVLQVDGRSEKWCPSTKLVDIAHQYESQRRQFIFQLNEQYEEATGEAL